LVCRAKGAIVNSHRDETGDFSGKNLELAAWLRPGWWESRAAWLIQELNPGQAILAPVNWYRCYGTIKVTGIAGMDETVIGYLSSAPDARWDSRECAFFDQRHSKYFLSDGVGMMVNGWFTQRFDMPPGYKGYGGGWHAVRAKMQSVGVYNTKTKTLLAAGNIPPPQPAGSQR